MDHYHRSLLYKLSFAILVELASCKFMELKYIRYICYHDHEIKMEIIIT